MNFGILPNIFGFLTLLIYIATLVPALIRVLTPRFRTNTVIQFLTRHRRWVGVTAFFTGLVHGLLITVERQLDFSQPGTWVKYFQGITLLTIFTLLTITSNDWSVRHLRQNWRRLHALTYVALIVLPWHILDKMAGQWSVFTPFAVVLSFGTILFVVFRKVKEWRANHQKNVLD